MSRFIMILCLPAVLALAAGCANRGDGNRTAQTWVGAPEAQLRAQWGEPTASVAENGETTLQYMVSRTVHVDGRPATVIPGVNGAPPTTIPATLGMDIALTCTWSFALRAEHVVRVNGAGNDCSSTPGPARAA